MNKITDNIYLGSFYALSATKTLKRDNVTHIISLVETDIKKDLIADFKHLRISIDDIEDENIMQYFPSVIEFMDEAINNGGSVLVHCMAGVSRSATAVCAYLMRTHVWTPEQALTFVKSKRSVANPNTSFLDQLKIFYQCGYEVTEAKAPYRQWLLKQKATDIALAGSIRPSDIVYTRTDSGSVMKNISGEKAIPEQTVAVESIVNGIASINTDEEVQSFPPSPDTIASNNTTTTSSSATSSTTTITSDIESSTQPKTISSRQATWRNTLPALLYVLGHRHCTPTARPQEICLICDEYPEGRNLELDGNPQEDLKNASGPSLKLIGFWSCEIVIQSDQLLPALAATTRRSTQLRCKKCSTPLALSSAYIIHTPAGSTLGKTTNSSSSKENGNSSFYKQGSSQSTSHLSNFFKGSNHSSTNGNGEKTSRFHLPLSRSLSQRGEKDFKSANASVTSLPEKNNSINFAPRNGMANNSTLPPSCMSYFVEPVVWMRPELDKGELEGKLNCPKCESKLGAYRWQGSKCSCGVWVTPAIQLQRSKVDEVSLTRNAVL